MSVCILSHCRAGAAAAASAGREASLDHSLANRNNNSSTAALRSLRLPMTTRPRSVVHRYECRKFFSLAATCCLCAAFSGSLHRDFLNQLLLLDQCPEANKMIILFSLVSCSCSSPFPFYSLPLVSPLFFVLFVFCFLRAIDAISLTWDNSHLKLILAHDNLSASNEPHSTNNINALGQPLWHGK